MSEVSFTEQEFNAEAARFVELCGSKAWWDGPAGRRTRCVNALMFMAMHTVTDAASAERVNVTMETVMSNYMRRAMHLHASIVDDEVLYAD